MPKKLTYQLVTNKKTLQQVLRRVRASGACALDIETTAFTPEEGRVRLAQLRNDAVRAVIDFDRIRGGFEGCAPLFENVEERPWIVFNTGFEMRWFQYAGVQPVIYDVQHLRRATLGGSNLSLKLMAKWDLDVELDKTQQASDWSKKELSTEQLEYAMEDADVTWRLWQLWSDKADPGRWQCFKLLNDLDLPVIEMEDAGMELNQRKHQRLVKGWEKLRDDRVAQVRSLVGEDEVANINSDTQWSDYFSKRMPDEVLRAWPRTEKSGQLQMTNETLKMLAGSFPGTPLEEFFDALSEYKTLNKYISSFGETLIRKAQMGGGRVHARYNIGAAKTLRFSSSGPNLQQIPRDKDDWFGDRMSIRDSFRAPAGRRLISLDYSGIELRVLGLLAEDEQLIYDMVHGDLHLEVGQFMAGRQLDKSKPADKAIRSAAKAVSFGIIYGSAAAGLSVSLRTSVGKAQDMIDFWEARYPRAFRMRHEKMDEAFRTKFIRMVDGGTIYMGSKPGLPKCANYPVQRAAWSIMARAIRLHWEDLEAARARGHHQTTRMLSTIHDALIDEASRREAADALASMERTMIQGYEETFPGAPIENLVEGGIGQTWATVE